MPVAKRCSGCRGTKPVGEFSKHKARDDGRQSYCKSCMRETCAAWYAVNKDRERETSAAWYAVNKERARETSAVWRAANKERARENLARWQRENRDRVREHNARRRARKAQVCTEPYDRAALFARWSHTCCYCSSPATDVEHITPISKGGDDILSNVTVACAACNSSKGAKTLAQWAVTF
ncbi:HNH endonuclease [Streptomyces sp. N2-109]|uniref:HNH endonuclease n=1 Tax=Streptomyces gossypii TaxID=2883101 RepID=A0ABT2K3Q7_9ACTN|nr:HNH endonuclease [Streptomyces gossypii]MCT2594259.1 HNH endonuclease [Streptomyces gossypii]